MKKNIQRLVIMLVLLVGVAGQSEGMLPDGKVNDEQKFDESLSPALVVAAKDGELTVVQNLLSQRANPSARVKFYTHDFISGDSSYVDTALNCALISGHEEIAQLLIAARACANQLDSRNAAPLAIASARGFPDLVKLLLAAKALVNACASNREPALRCASAKGCAESVQLLLAANALVNAQDYNGDTALITASDYPKNTDVVKLLLAAKALVNMQENHGTTALMRACFFGCAETAQVLMSARADITLKNEYGEDALGEVRREFGYRAGEKGYIDMVRLLIMAIVESEWEACPLEVIKEEIIPFVE